MRVVYALPIFKNVYDVLIYKHWVGEILPEKLNKQELLSATYHPAQDI